MAFGGHHHHSEGPPEGLPGRRGHHGHHDDEHAAAHAAPPGALGGAPTALVLASALNGLIVLIEVAGWLRTGAVALLADAGHNLTDVGALVLAYVALRASEQPANARRSFGYFRYEILAALVNGALLIVVSIAIFVLAALRLGHPEAVPGSIVTGIAVLAITANGASAFLLFPSRENLNLKAAFAHLAADALSAVGVLVAGLLLLVGFPLADPIAAIVIGILIVLSGYGVLAEAVEVLLEAPPRHIDLEAVRRRIASLPEVRAVHDLHVWALAPKNYLATLHVVVDSDSIGACNAIIERVQDALAAEYGIGHATVQVETSHADDEQVADASP